MAMTGTFTLPEAKIIAVRILDACAEHNMTKILFDLRSLRGSPSILERFEFASYLVSTFQNKLGERFGAMKMAAVAGAPFMDPHKFGETVAVNRGLNLKVTTDLAEACAWLGIEVPVESQ